MAHHVVRQPNGKFAVFSTDEGRFVTANLAPADAIQFLESLHIKARYAQLRVSNGVLDRPFSTDGGYTDAYFAHNDRLGRWCQCLSAVMRRHGWATAERAIRECSG
jgi:hypothetical protein